YLGAPGALLDRSSLTPADLAAASKVKAAELRQLFARFGLRFASLAGDMAGPTLVGTLAASGGVGARSGVVLNSPLPFGGEGRRGCGTSKDLLWPEGDSWISGPTVATGFTHPCPRGGTRRWQSRYWQPCAWS